MMPDLTTLESLKAWMALPQTNPAADAQLQTLISSCSNDFGRATNRPDLLTANYVEVRQGDGSGRMILYHWPVGAVSEVRIAGLVIPPSSDKIIAGWYVDADIDPERAFNLYLNAYAFTDGAAVQVTYSGGYAVVPPDVAQAVNDWVAYRYKQLPNLGATQRRLNEGESVQQTQDDAPASTKSVIEHYCRRIPSISRRHDEEQGRLQGAALRRGAR